MTLHVKGRAKALEPFGWTGRRAERIALACFHGGVFTRAQCTDFLGRHHEKVRRAVHRLVAQGVAVEENPPRRHRRRRPHPRAWDLPGARRGGQASSSMSGGCPKFSWNLK